MASFREFPMLKCRVKFLAHGLMQPTSCRECNLGKEVDVRVPNRRVTGYGLVRTGMVLEIRDCLQVPPHRPKDKLGPPLDRLESPHLHCWP